MKENAVSWAAFTFADRVSYTPDIWVPLLFIPGLLVLSSVDNTFGAGAGRSNGLLCQAASCPKEGSRDSNP